MGTFSNMSASSDANSLGARIALMNARNGQKVSEEKKNVVATDAKVADSREENKDIYERVIAPVDVDTLQDDGPTVQAAIAELAKLIEAQTKEIKKINKHVNAIVKKLGK